MSEEVLSGRGDEVTVCAVTRVAKPQAEPGWGWLYKCIALYY